MSKKKSYMSTKNILSEDVISSFFKGLLRGILRQKPKSLRKTKNELKDKIDKFNIGIDKMYTAINKVREKDGLKPKKRPKKLNVDKVIQDLDTGKK